MATRSVEVTSAVGGSSSSSRASQRRLATGHGVRHVLDVVGADAAEALDHEPDERVAALRVVARQLGADHRDPRVAERDQVLQADAGCRRRCRRPRSGTAAGSSPARAPRPGRWSGRGPRAGAAGPACRRAARSRRSGGSRGPPAATTPRRAAGVPQHHVVAAPSRIRRPAPRSRRRRTGRRSRGPRRPAASSRRRAGRGRGGSGGSRAVRAARRTRSRVASVIGTLVETSFRTRDTVLCETPAATAMSRIVGTNARARTGGAGAPWSAAGSGSAARPDRSIVASSGPIVQG